MFLTGKNLFIYRLKKIHDFILKILTVALFVSIFFMMFVLS